MKTNIYVSIDRTILGMHISRLIMNYQRISGLYQFHSQRKQTGLLQWVNRYPSEGILENFINTLEELEEI